MKYKRIGKNKYRRIKSIISIVLMLLAGVSFVVLMLIINLIITLTMGG